MLSIENLGVELGTRSVLAQISLELPEGELVCVLGPNGAGKTTLLRAIAGLVPAHGSIRLDGSDLAHLKANERARRVAYLPQGHVAHWAMPARDIVALGRLPHGASPDRLSPGDRAAVERALAAVDAAHLADRPVTAMSGGERARVMLARALAVEAPVLLADEAIAALDPAHQLAVLALLRQRASHGCHVLATLHDLTLASRFASRVVVLDSGAVAGCGPPCDVLDARLLAATFRIEAQRVEVAGETALVPWSTSALSRR